MLFLVVALAAVAAAVLSPDIIRSLKSSKPGDRPAEPTLEIAAEPVAPTPPAVPDSREAIDALLVVRNRLQAAGELTPETARAIDQLWIDLLHGGAK